MPWVRIDDLAPEHPKMLAAGPTACWLWVCGLAYCSRHLTDGNIPPEAVGLMGVPKVQDAVARLLREGLWEETASGYHVHDYHLYQPSREQVSGRRKRAADRVADWRKRKGYASGNADVTPLQDDAKRPRNAVSNAAPVPVPVPIEREKEPDSLSEDALAERAGAFIRWYESRYFEVRGARYLSKPVRDYDHAMRLVRTYADEDWLRQMAGVYLLTDHPDAERSSRTIGQFTALAGWCDAQLRAHGRRPLEVTA